MTEAAHQLGALTPEEYKKLKRFDHLRDIVVRVDDFSSEELFPNQQKNDKPQSTQNKEESDFDTAVA